jgi:hypothetical protein
VETKRKKKFRHAALEFLIKNTVFYPARLVC